MIRRRASLATLMGFVAILAVGLAAMKVATVEAWRLVFGFGLLALLVGTLGALVRTRGRAAWVGFALFGWAYALVILVHPLREAIAGELPGDETLYDVIVLLHPSPGWPTPPAFYSEGTDAVWKMEDGQYQLKNRLNGQTAILSSQQAREWEAYDAPRRACEARDQSVRQAHRIALTFLGAAFACVGAIAGQVLGDRQPVSGASPANPSSTPPG